MKEVIGNLRQDLQENVDAKTMQTSQNFFKEKISFYGVKVPLVHKISREHFKGISKLPKEEVFRLCEELWQSGIIEESFVACNWSYYVRKDYKPEDFEVFSRWINNYVNNWASCDTLCNHTLGEFLMMYPEYVKQLKTLTSSPNRWMRRAASVSLIIPARKGLFLNDILEIARLLLHDPDDLVQKGYGWMLKAASEANQKLVFDFVVRHKQGMPRTALRYAIEKMPDELRREAMAK